MEKNKIGVRYSALVVLLFAVVCFLTVYIVVDRKLDGNKSGSSVNSNVSDNNDSNVTDNNQIINKTSLVIDYSRECDYVQCVDPNEKVIKIDIVNGDIVISGYGRTVKYLSSNAISLNFTSVHQGHDEVLFYITDDNMLFNIGTIDCYLNDYCDKFFDDMGNHSPDMLADNVSGFVYKDNGSYNTGYTTFKHLHYSYLPVVDIYGNMLNVYLDFPSYYGGVERYNFIQR